MADTKISDLAALVGVGIAATDEFVIVDKSDTSMAASGTDKRMAADELAQGLATRVPTGMSHRTGGLYRTPPAVGGTATNGSALTLNLLYAIPFEIPEPATYVNLGALMVTTANLEKVRLGIYADDNGRPGALLSDFGATVAQTGTGQGGFKSITPGSPVSLAAGWVWLASVVQGAVGTFLCSLTSLTGNPSPLGVLSPSGGAVPSGLSGATGVTGALPASFEVPALTSVSTTVSTNVFNKTSHGLVNTLPVILSGLTNTTGVSDGVPYFVVGSAANTFQLALTSGGAAIDLTGSDDSTVITVTPLPQERTVVPIVWATRQ